MKSTDIKKVRYNNDEVVALYKGNTLIYKKVTENPNRVGGSFSEPGDYSIKYNKWTDVPLTLNDDLTFEIQTEKYWDCSRMFQGLDKLLSVSNLPDTTGVTYFQDMFYGCTNLTQIDFTGVDTSSLHYIDTMSYGCSSLTDIIGIDFDFDMLYGAQTAFLGCSSLTNVSGTIRNLKINFDLSSCPLTNASAMVFINALAEIPETRFISFSSATYATLTDEQIALATSRGWSVVDYPTYL